MAFALLNAAVCARHGRMESGTLVTRSETRAILTALSACAGSLRDICIMQRWKRYLPVHMLANVFHYGQALFEGFKGWEMLRWVVWDLPVCNSREWQAFTQSRETCVYLQTGCNALSPGFSQREASEKDARASRSWARMNHGCRRFRIPEAAWLRKDLHLADRVSPYAASG